MTPRRTIIEVLFPKVRAEVLRLLFTPPAKKRYVRELQGLSGLALSTVQDELRKLAVLGVIVSWRDRRHRFYAPNRNHPLFSDLLHIVQVSERLPDVKHVHLQRPRYGSRRKGKRRRKFAHLPVILEPQWHLFSNRRKRSTA